MRYVAVARFRQPLGSSGLPTSAAVEFTETVGTALAHSDALGIAKRAALQALHLQSAKLGWVMSVVGAIFFHNLTGSHISCPSSTNPFSQPPSMRLTISRPTRHTFYPGACSSYSGCRSCTTQAGCVWYRNSCTYSRGTNCAEDPANCVNYAEQVLLPVNLLVICLCLVYGLALITHNNVVPD